MIFRWPCRPRAIQGTEGCTHSFSYNSKVSQVNFICIAHESHSVSRRALQARSSKSFWPSSASQGKTPKATRKKLYSRERSFLSGTRLKVYSRSSAHNPPNHLFSAAYLCLDHGVRRLRKVRQARCPSLQTPSPALLRLLDPDQMGWSHWRVLTLTRSLPLDGPAEGVLIRCPT